MSANEGSREFNTSRIPRSVIRDLLILASRELADNSSPKLPARLPAVLDTTECSHHAAAILGARGRWNSAFAGAQHSLGRAFYTHLEEARTKDYFLGQLESDETVEAILPGLQSNMLRWVQTFVQQPVQRRPGYCGPGVHIFPGSGSIAKRGGEIHFDDEGLTEADRFCQVPCVTAVLMLAAAQRGGGLRLWNRPYEYRAKPFRSHEVGLPDAVVTYLPGDLWILDAYQLHQIEPFSGVRISMTCHAVLRGDHWEAWF